MYYLAYGSNLNKEHMKRLCYNAKPIGVGILKGYKLYFNFYADIKESENDSIYVGVWEINKKDEEMLDWYEGFPSLYHKELLEFEFEDGTKEEGMVYIMNNYKGRIMKPSTDYLNTILEGYKDFGINCIDNIEKALYEANIKP